MVLFPIVFPASAARAKPVSRIFTAIGSVRKIIAALVVVASLTDRVTAEDKYASKSLHPFARRFYHSLWTFRPRLVHCRCWKWTAQRGIGTVPTQCASGQEMNGLLCYDVCRPGFYGVGPVCWSNCAAGYTDIGALCYRARDQFALPSYSRELGSVLPLPYCPAPKVQKGACAGRARSGGTTL